MAADRLDQTFERLAKALAEHEKAVAVLQQTRTSKRRQKSAVDQRLRDISGRTEAALNALLERRSVDPSSMAFAALARYSLHQLALATMAKNELAGQAMTTNLRILAIALSAPASGYQDPTLDAWRDTLGSSGPLPTPTTSNPHPHAPAMAQLIRQVRDAGLRLDQLAGLYAVNERDLHLIQPS
ncbi:MAG: hypothetical protein SFX74_09735 [Fimbriimonadaceae bacterium]|nr:hypothetical protein [Fimbriimonadaceae bacterium]